MFWLVTPAKGRQFLLRYRPNGAHEEYSIAKSELMFLSKGTSDLADLQAGP